MALCFFLTSSTFAWILSIISRISSTCRQNIYCNHDSTANIPVSLSNIEFGMKTPGKVLNVWIVIEMAVNSFKARDCAQYLSISEIT